jgi:two-component SAPR family response regulator
MMTISLFGSMRASLKYSRHTQPLTLTPRVAEMLAFLALRRGQYFLRSELSVIMSCHDENSVTVGNVNTILWRLRRVVEPRPAQRGAYLVNSLNGGIGLNGPESVHVDVVEFERCVSVGLLRPMGELTEADFIAFRAGFDLYSADPLSDFVTPWAVRERDRVRTLFLDATTRLMRWCARRNEYADAIQYARVVLNMDPVREDVHRDIMRYMVSNGQRPLALRQFEVCREALRKDLGIHPTGETITLYRDIANGSDNTHRPPAPPAGP